MSSTHIFIPDTQVKPGVPMDHLHWIGRYIVDQFAGRDNVRIIHIGDHYDFPSLSVYDKPGSKTVEGRRLADDLTAGHEGWDILNAPLVEYNVKRRLYKERMWHPDKHVTLGNHEQRLARAVDANPLELDGVLGYDSLAFTRYGWTVHDFLQPVILDGVHYAHYFYQPMSGRPLGSAAATRLKQLGFSFSQGHQQIHETAIRYVGNRQQRALISGACYLHDEDYRGYQANSHWRGIVVKHRVADGEYAIMEVGLDYLCERYERVTLDEFMAVNYPRHARYRMIAALYGGLG